MLIICPGCKANFVFDDVKIDRSGVKLKCFKCKTVFKIVRKKREFVLGNAANISNRPAQVVKFVIAHESPAFCEAVKRVVANEPFLVYDCNDGGEAMEIIERVKPDAVLLDVALPTMYGFEICEAMRKNHNLDHTRIILLAAIYDKRRYRRDPASLYGADEVIEKHRIPDELVSLVYSLVGSVPAELRPESSELLGAAEQLVVHEQEWLAASSEAVADAEKFVVTPGNSAEPHEASCLKSNTTIANDVLLNDAVLDQANDSLLLQVPDLPVVEIEPEPFPVELAQSFVDEVTIEESSHVAAAPDPEALPVAELPEDHVKASRLARIIVSDIALYNPEKVVQGVKDGTLRSLLAEEIAEGLALYTKRVSEEVRIGTDYYEVALHNFIEKKKLKLCS